MAQRILVAVDGASMGADGGLEWVRVIDRPRFTSLIKVFEFTFWPNSDDYYDSYHDAYLKKFPLSADFIISAYTNLNDYNFGIDDLRRMLDDSKLVDYEDMTFADVVLDILTKPDSWDDSWGDLTIERALKRILSQYHTAERYSRATADPVLGMEIRKWSKAVRETIDVKSFGSAETWT